MRPSTHLSLPSETYYVLRNRADLCPNDSRFIRVERWPACRSTCRVLIWDAISNKPWKKLVQALLGGPERSGSWSVVGLGVPSISLYTLCLDDISIRVRSDPVSGLRECHSFPCGAGSTRMHIDRLVRVALNRVARIEMTSLGSSKYTNTLSLLLLARLLKDGVTVATLHYPFDM